MSAHTVTASVALTGGLTGRKASLVTFTGSASYDSGGSNLALGTTDTAMDVHAGFASAVSGGVVIQCSGSNADKYFCTFIPGSGTTVKVVVRDAEAGTAASEVSGDISGLTFTAIVFGV